MKKLLVFALTILFLTGIEAQAATINAASCSYDDVKIAVDAASDGDTVLVPAGEAVWTSMLTFVKVKYFYQSFGNYFYY